MSNELDKISDILKYTAIGISCVSFICSLIVLRLIYYKKLQKNLTNKYIIQLTLSEMINNLTNASNLINDWIGTKEFKYDERMRVCYSQMYTGLFANFFTLFSSLLIAFRIHDLLVNNSRVFKSQQKIHFSQVFSVFFCLFLAYLVWILQMSVFQEFSTVSQSYFLVIACFVGQEMTYLVISIYFIFILLIFYFCLRSYRFVNNYTKSYLLEDSSVSDGEYEKLNEQVNKAKSVQKRLLLYPVCTVILFLLLIIQSFLVFFIKEKDGSTSYKMKIVNMILYIIPTVSRGFIFGIVYLGSQQAFMQSLWEHLTCKACKKTPAIDPVTVNSLGELEEEE